MPLINGQKMACAPCIRGHRSTKCNHAAERVMVPVRKPGRPLSSCPCPPGRPCACGGVKVAIPRKQKCHCGPDSELPSDESAGSETPASEPPPSPSKASSSYRVQKSASTPRQNGSSRKQSFDPANLERIDPNSVNILPQYPPHMDLPKSPPVVGNGGTHPQMHTTPGPGFGFVPQMAPNGYGNVAGVGYGAAMGGYGMPTFHHPMGPPVAQAAPVREQEAMGRLTRSDGPFDSQKLQSPSADKSGSCCAPPPPKPSDKPASSDTDGSAQQSCCCSGSKAESPGLKPLATPVQQLAQPGGALVPHFHHQPMSIKPQQYPVPFPQRPTIFTYPANYGSWSHPVNQAMWAQMHHIQPGPVAYSNAMPAALAAPSAATNGAGNSVLEISHECNCGPGCQCVGCLAHPFNQEMLQYVGGAWDYDLDAPAAEVFSSSSSNSATRSGSHARTSSRSNSRRTSHVVTTTAIPNSNAATSSAATATGAAAAVSAASTNGGHDQAKNHVHKTEPGSPPQAPTPSDSVCSDEQALSTSDYFFVNLPLFPGADTDTSACGGNQALCPCGDDCQCDGCIVHNAKPLEQLGP